MIKGLEALCYLDDIAHGRKMHYDAHELKLIVEKELKALEIIRKKEIDIWLFNISDDFNNYNWSLYLGYHRKDTEKCQLTQEEFDLLKEVLS